MTEAAFDGQALRRRQTIAEFCCEAGFVGANLAIGTDGWLAIRKPLRDLGNQRPRSSSACRIGATGKSKDARIRYATVDPPPLDCRDARGIVRQRATDERRDAVTAKVLDSRLLGVGQYFTQSDLVVPGCQRSEPTTLLTSDRA